jgi:protein transport protein SEC13
VDRIPFFYLPTAFEMASFPIDTQHDDMIHDSQFDYYSKRMATCSSDRTIKIFDITGNIHHNSATLTGHEGPVWQIAWAHPKFGVILASCSYDGTVIIHREATQNSWSKVYEHKFHESSVNSISWAPHEFGLILACASSDGKVSILEYKDESWICTSIQNDTLGCNTVTWGPVSALGSLLEDGSSTQRLATGSCDNMVRMYKLQNGKWEEEARESSPHIGRSVRSHATHITMFAILPNIIYHMLSATLIEKIRNPMMISA